MPVELRRKLQAKYADADFIAGISAGQASATPSPEDIFLQNVAGHVLKRLDDLSFGNEELSLKMAMSESQLNRKVKAISGRTLSLFIRGIRLQQAKALLETTSMNISEVAYSVGYSDPAYFSRTFSEEFGVPPTNIRK
ncbi:MAG: helix-turn-helix transcriptional regulator [Lewinellaceae bacterium]|nr:helix-turn-helix transcriptional regulator [Lewinellaceae bacterium]